MLLIYGAYGKTGRLIVQTAIQRGHEVLLAGKNRARLDQAAAETGARAAAVSLTSSLALRDILRRSACVINVAGPFAETYRPLLEACEVERVPYVDLNGELDVFRDVERYTTAHPPTVPVVVGSGFGVAAGESAALHAAASLRRVERIWVGLEPALGQRSLGAIRSTLLMAAEGGAVVEEGGFVKERMGRRSFQNFISAPLGELWAIRRSTGARTVIAGAAVPFAESILLRSGILGLISRSEGRREWLAKQLVQAPSEGSLHMQSQVWAKAEDGKGHVSEVRLTMGEGYQWSAEMAVLAAERIHDNARPGLWTPGQYFGKEFALAVPGTALIELSSDRNNIPVTL